MVNFLKKNKFIILPILLLVPILFGFLASSQLAPKKESRLIPTQALSSVSSPRSQIFPTGETNTQPEEGPTQALNKAAAPIPTEANTQPIDEFEDTWETSAYLYFSEDYLKGVQFEKNVRADGSIAYTYASDNPKRPDMMIVKDGVVVFKRMLVLDMKVDNYITGMGKPDYIARGSVFYGPDAVTYIYFKTGVAFVANPKTNVVFEDLSFKPVPPSEFKQNYGEDLTGGLERQSN